MPATVDEETNRVLAAASDRVVAAHLQAAYRHLEQYWVKLPIPSVGRRTVAVNSDWQAMLPAIRAPIFPSAASGASALDTRRSSGSGTPAFTSNGYARPVAIAMSRQESPRNGLAVQLKQKSHLPDPNSLRYPSNSIDDSAQDSYNQLAVAVDNTSRDRGRPSVDDDSVAAM